MLDVKQATKVFSAGTASEHHALNGLNLHLDEGEFVTIIGSNGAGKSTMFNAICGDFLTDSGSIVLDGEDITFLPQHARAKNIGWSGYHFSVGAPQGAPDRARVPGSDERNGTASDDRGKSGAGIYPEGSEAISKCGPQTGKGSIPDRA